MKRLQGIEIIEKLRQVFHLEYKEKYFNALNDVKELLKAQRNIIKENEHELMAKMYAVAIYDGIAICYGILTGEEPQLYEEENNE